MRLPLPNQKATEGNKDFNPYAQDRCCICARKTGAADSWLLCARDDQGQEYAVSHPSEAWPEFDRAYLVPIGAKCLQAHPELRFALLAVGGEAAPSLDRLEAFHKWLDVSWPLWKGHQGSVHYMEQRHAFYAGLDARGSSAEPESKPVAYALRSKDDGSLFDSIVPVGYATFDARMERFRKEPWVVNGRAEIVPLYDSSQYVSHESRRVTARTILRYNKDTKKIEKVTDGVVVGSFDPPPDVVLG